MGIEARLKTRPADWLDSFVRVEPRRRAGRLLVRINLAHRIGLELRLTHARRLADALHDACDSFDHHHEEKP